MASYDSSVSPIPVQNPVDLTNQVQQQHTSSTLTSDYLAMISPSITMVAPSSGNNVSSVGNGSIEQALDQEMFDEDAMASAPLDVPLYSPLQHLNYSGSHPGTGNHVTQRTPLEDWIKQPNNLTLTDDALMASLNNGPEPPTPTSLFNEGASSAASTALPSFSQATGNEAIYTSSPHMQSWDDPKSLPPLENTLDFEHVEFSELPS